MRKRNIFVVLFLVLAGVAGYLFYNNANKASAATTTTGQIVTVGKGNLIATVASSGLVASASQVALSFGSTGTVKQVYVKLGDQVKKGQVLAELDSTDLQFALANSQLSLNQAQIKFDLVKAGPTAADLAAAQLNVDTAQATYDTAVRKAGLNDQQLLIYRNSLDKSAIALQKAQSDYNVAVSNRVTDLTTLSTALQQAKLDYTSAQANYNIQVAEHRRQRGTQRGLVRIVCQSSARNVTEHADPGEPGCGAGVAGPVQAELAAGAVQHAQRAADRAV